MGFLERTKALFGLEKKSAPDYGLAVQDYSKWRFNWGWNKDYSTQDFRHEVGSLDKSSLVMARSGSIMAKQRRLYALGCLFYKVSMSRLTLCTLGVDRHARRVYSLSMMTETNTQPLESTQIRRTMRRLVSECVDSDTGEVNCTQLAENAAHELGHDEWLDDSDHILWDFAVDVAEAYQRRAR